MYFLTNEVPEIGFLIVDNNDVIIELKKNGSVYKPSRILELEVRDGVKHLDRSVMNDKTFYIIESTVKQFFYELIAAGRLFCDDNTKYFGVVQLYDIDIQGELKKNGVEPVAYINSDCFRFSNELLDCVNKMARINDSIWSTDTPIRIRQAILTLDLNQELVINREKKMLELGDGK